MSTEIDQSAMIAQDGYGPYYTEKLWSWIPGFYREEDAGTHTPGTLRQLVETMGGQSAELRRALDRLWENSFVELADDDALAQLGELVATRMVHELNRRARRIDVARTIFYRRRKGTPWVLERLINDIAGWTGSHLDTRRRLARSYHLLEPRPQLSSVTQTPRGGWANLRSPRIPALAWTAFEELNHTPDFRRQRGQQGRYGISKVGVHVHRTRALELNYPTVAQIGPNPGVGQPWKFALDPSGRAVPLFQPADRPTGDAWNRPREWQMPRAIERRLLAHAEYEWTDATLEALVGAPLTAGAVALLQPYSGWRVRSTLELERLIASLPSGLAKDSITDNIATLKAATLIPDCGSARIYAKPLALALGEDNDAALELSRQQVMVADLSEWGANLDPELLDAYELIIDPVTGAVISNTTSDTVRLIAPRLHLGAAAELGAGTYDRRRSIETVGVNLLPGGGDALGPIALTPSGAAAIDQISNSKTYSPPDTIVGVEDYRLQAANQQRPYLLVVNETATWTITAAPKLSPDEQRCLVLDGLWIGVTDSGLAPQILADPHDPCTPVPAKLVLAGTWDRVEIRNCTLDPGGEKLRATPLQGVVIPYVILELQGYIEELVIEASILGPIHEDVSGANPCSVGKLKIRDSIVCSIDLGNTDAIITQFGEVHLERTTVIGKVTANRLYATDSLIGGEGNITDLQHGCFRFSAGVESNWPRPFEAYLFTTLSGSTVESITFGQPGFLRLTEFAPAELREGAENHCAMGAFNKLIEPIKRADLRSKLDEFMPFDLIEQIVPEN